MSNAKIVFDDGSVLMHGDAPYDPVKAREYYLRTRKLKGRPKGTGKETDSFQKTKSESYTVTYKGKQSKLSPQELSEQKAYAAKRVADIKRKLAKLGQELKKRMAEARKAEAKAKKGPTAADKAEAARDSAKYRDKNQQKIETKAKQADSKEKAKPKADTSVEGLKKTINDVKASLNAAVDRQRALSSASKNG